MQRELRSLRRSVRSVSITGLILAAAMLARVLPAQIGYAHPKAAQAGDLSAAHKPVAALSPYIDVHTHLDETNVEGSMQAAIGDMPEENLAKIVFMPSPFTLADANRFDVERLVPAAKKYPGKIYLLGGGGTLNPMIIEAARSGNAGPEVERKFKERAEAILAAGAVGFGEMAAEHFPSSTPYESAPADHPLFLLLADIAAAARRADRAPYRSRAAGYGFARAAQVSAESAAAARQYRRVRASSRAQSARQDRLGPPRFGYDRLSHAGTDARLLEAHPNLFMEIKMDPVGPGEKSAISKRRHDQAGMAEALYDFQDRFVIGSDQHYPQARAAALAGGCAALQSASCGGAAENRDRKCHPYL